MDDKRLLVYLAGHIHGDWRDRVAAMAGDRDLPVDFAGPCTDHSLSDAIGVQTLGVSEQDVGSAEWFKGIRDATGGAINNLRTRIWIHRCDLLIAFFDQDEPNLRQWNTPTDIGVARAAGKPVLIVGGPKLTHSLKEAAAGADVLVETLEQAVEVLAYICGD
jgi:YtoQ family protein